MEAVASPWVLLIVMRSTAPPCVCDVSTRLPNSQTLINDGTAALAPRRSGTVAHAAPAGSPAVCWSQPKPTKPPQQLPVKLGVSVCGFGPSTKTLMWTPK